MISNFIWTKKISHCAVNIWPVMKIEISLNSIVSAKPAAMTVVSRTFAISMNFCIHKCFSTDQFHT